MDALEAIFNAVQSPVKNPASEKVLKAVFASYPGAKAWATEPLDMNKALQGMAQYEQENPLGSALSFMGNVVAGKGARGFKQAEALGRVFGGAVDELPRFEIADDLAKLKPESMKYFEESGMVPRLDSDFANIPVKSVLDHPEVLQSNYPEIGDYSFSGGILSEMDKLKAGKERGYFDPKSKHIHATGITPEELKSTLLHEIQHAIQEREGFAKGGSPQAFQADYERDLFRLPEVERHLQKYENIASDEARRFIATNDPIVNDAIKWSKQYEDGLFGDLQDIVKSYILEKDDGYSRLYKEQAYLKYGEGKLTPEKRYSNLAGEVESRNVQGRMNMTDAERQAKPFNETFDVPVKDQIKRMQSGTMASVTDNPNFKKWFGDSKVVDEKGEPLTVYHGTNKSFDKFNRSRSDIGLHFGTSGQANDRIAYKALKGGDVEGQNVMPVYLNIKNPLRMKDAGLWNADNLNYQLKDLFPNEAERISRLKTTKDLREFIQNKGYDGIVYRNTGETAGGTELIKEMDELWGKFVEAHPQAKSGSISPELQRTKEYKAYNKAYEKSTKFIEQNGEDSYIAFSPTQIKSAIGNSGKFDPKDPNILKSIIPVGGAIGLEKKMQDEPKSYKALTEIFRKAQS